MFICPATVVAIVAPSCSCWSPSRAHQTCPHIVPPRLMASLVGSRPCPVTRPSFRASPASTVLIMTLRVSFDNFLIIWKIIFCQKENASRLCLSNGTWAERADYDRCKPLKIEHVPIEVMCDRITL